MDDGRRVRDHRRVAAPRAVRVRLHQGPGGAERFVRGGLWGWTVGTLLAGLPVAKREFVLKDIKLFFRDASQWSQLILLAVLVVVYLFNIKALPLHRGEEVGFFYTTLVSFLNLGLAGFVLASIAARFIFPAVSLEGRHMWLLRSSPLDLRALLWSKYWVGTLPLLVLALLLTGLTNVLLKVGPFMMVMGLVTICCSHLRHGGDGAGVRRAVSAVRNRKRGADSDVVRRPGLHDGHGRRCSAPSSSRCGRPCTCTSAPSTSGCRWSWMPG